MDGEHKNEVYLAALAGLLHDVGKFAVAGLVEPELHLAFGQRHRLGDRLLEVGDDHDPAGGGEPVADGRPDAPATAGDQSHARCADHVEPPPDGPGRPSNEGRD